MKDIIYIKTLKRAEHTVFCIEDGQKTYYDPQFNRVIPYSSGQQIKRSVIEAICDAGNIPVSPITFLFDFFANSLHSACAFLSFVW